MKDKIEKENEDNITKSLAKYAFQTRFFLSRLTRKSRIIKKIADKSFLKIMKYLSFQIRAQ